MENNFFRRIPTDLDLNGPTLAYTTQPSDVIVNPEGTATFTVAAEATFSGNAGASDSGTITFQWYEDSPFGGGKTALTNDGKFSGVDTATLTVADCRTPEDTRRFFLCEISYTPGDEYDSSDKGTAGAPNEPLASNNCLLQVNPLLQIVSQPSNAISGENQTATFTIDATLTSNAPFPRDADAALELPVYQWYVGLGAAAPTLVENKTYTTQNIEQVTTIVPDESFVTDTYSQGAGRLGNNSTFTTPPTAYNLEFVVASSRGGRGGDDAGGGGGLGGNGRGGAFTVPNSQARGHTFTFRIGTDGGSGGRGNFWAFGPPGSGLRVGGRGGGAGPRGWSGGGGGGGGSAGLFRGGTLLASAGGGGGGGGGSHQAGQAPNGANANGWYPYNGATITTYNGGNGEDSHDDGGGGGGGGAGSGGSAGGGYHGHDRSRPGGGGGGGNSDYRSDIVNLQRQWESGWANGSYSFSYTVTRPVVTPRPVITDIIKYQNAVISGQGSPELTITVDNADFNTDRSIYCVVSSSSAGNSPLTSNTVDHSVVDASQINDVIIEQIGSDNIAREARINLSNGEIELQAENEAPTVPGALRLYSIYSPNKDIDIEMDLYGGTGKKSYDSKTGSHNGGEGGYSRIRFTLEKKVEYIIGGMTRLINTPFVYRKAQLIAVVGAGGDASPFYPGGKGGGINIAGGRAPSSGAFGGSSFAAGTLPSDGIWSGLFVPSTGVYPEDQYRLSSTLFADGNRIRGGRTLPCTKGVYYRQQGIAACADVHGGPIDGVLYQIPLGGFPTFLAADGTRVRDADWINRGYKDGYVIQANGGLGRANTRRDSATGTRAGYANGGCGAEGGNGGLGIQGGGGGSGYTDGSVTVVSTQLGGSTRTNATVILRLAV